MKEFTNVEDIFDSRRAYSTNRLNLLLEYLTEEFNKNIEDNLEEPKMVLEFTETHKEEYSTPELEKASQVFITKLLDSEWRSYIEGHEIKEDYIILDLEEEVVFEKLYEEN